MSLIGLPSFGSDALDFVPCQPLISFGILGYRKFSWQKWSLRLTLATSVTLGMGKMLLYRGFVVCGSKFGAFPFYLYSFRHLAHDFSLWATADATDLHCLAKGGRPAFQPGSYQREFRCSKEFEHHVNGSSMIMIISLA